MQYYWRYLIARWGYATNIHSFEVTNEGDPFDGNHYDLTNAMAGYFLANDPNKHLVTTSMWGSFPVGLFWANPLYPNVGYTDEHRYVGEDLVTASPWSWLTNGWYDSWTSWTGTL